MKKLTITLGAILFATALIVTPPFRSAAKEDKFKRSNRPIQNRYIVVFDESEDFVRVNPADMANELATQYPGSIRHIYSNAIKGYSVEMSGQEAERLSFDSRVKYVEEDGQVTISTTQYGAAWGLDRIDQHTGPYDGNFIYDKTGLGVHAYVIDTGIRATHSDFGGRIGSSFDGVGDGQNGNDCNGHGTHVAGTIGGTKYGVAKDITLHAVRVLNCEGNGSTSGVIAGVDWVTHNRVLPAVANMSLIAGGISSAMDTAVADSIASGVTYTLAAGNGNQDACGYSPARVPNAITVGASTRHDERAFFSNWGSCVDIFSPGYEITSAWNTDDFATRILNGTSMAAPHAAGVAALYLESDPLASTSAVSQKLSQGATSGLLTNTGVGSPNLLLFSRIQFSGGVCGGTNYGGFIPVAGSYEFQSGSAGFAGQTGTYSGTLNVPVGAQMQLKLEVKKGSRWSAVASSSGSNSTENITYRGKSGTYRWRIQSVTGSGSYSMCSVNP